ncbi:hypothetical protein [Nocardia cyriacigeorgica]|uniref:hypothetical protein n=1 Tax=Nocardia cyriacigeorgica TaxID=135487 RepID=UPI0013D8D17B|nr:hypothetical protein [Nocardia cyriacigeorgica]NEW27232.1 hypothetical protein [Nocardia cyriacigeorgica]
MIQTPSAVLAAMGMDKAGTFAMPTGGTGLIQGWAARSGFPATAIASDTSLVANGIGNVTVQARIQLTGNWVNASLPTFRVLKNGVQIGQVQIGFNSNAATFSPMATSLAPGDTLDMQYVMPSGQSGTVQQGAAATYLYYTLA